MRRAQAQTITFFAIDAASPPARKTGIAFSAGDVKIGKNGGALSNTGSLPVEVALGVYALTLTAAETNASWIHITVRNAAMQPQDISGSMSEQPAASVVSGSAAAFVTDLTSVIDDFWKNSIVCFTSGALAGQVRKVTAYTGATKTLSFADPFTAAPGASDLFILINI